MGKRKNKNPVLNLQPTTSAAGEKSEIMSQHQSPTTSTAGEKSEIMTQHQSPNSDSTTNAEIMSQHQSPNPDSTTKDADATTNNPNQGRDKMVEDAVISNHGRDHFSAVISNHGRDHFSAGDKAILKAIQNLANQVGNQRKLSLFLSIVEGVKAVASLAGCAALTWAAFSAKKSSNSFNQACQKWGKKDGPALFEVTIFKGMKLPKFALFPKIRLPTFGGKGKGRLEGSQVEA